MSDQRTFVGEPGADGNRLWFVDGTGLRRPVEHVARYSPQGLSWGYAGKGAADTALSLLTAATGSLEAAERHERAFLDEVVAKLPVNERFALPVARVDAWLAERGVTDLGPARRQPVVDPDGQDLSGPGVAGAPAPTSLASRARALDERERQLRDREARVDAMAAAVGLLGQVRADTLPAEPARRQLEALVIDTGDDLDDLAAAHGLDPAFAGAVLAGTVRSLDLGQVRQVCEGLRCTPYDIWGPAARSIAHAYGPDQWPASTEPLLPVDGQDLPPLALAGGWPVSEPPGPPVAGPALSSAPDLGPELVP